MGIFSRFRDIVNANINALLEKAEDPHAMIKLIVQEMEDTLVEMKATCAGSLAARTKTERAIRETLAKATDWHEKAKLALERNREDLAREAILEKIRLQKEAAELEKDFQGLNELVNRSLEEIDLLEGKLNKARVRAHELAAKHREAVRKGRARPISAQTQTDPFARFDEIQRAVEQMDADAPHRPQATSTELENELDNLRHNHELEQEMQRLKQTIQKDPVKTE